MRWIKLTLRIFKYGIYALVAFAVGAIAVLTLTERGRDNLAGLISDMASSPEQTIRIGGISGIWSGNLRLGSLVVGDSEGPWLTARNIAVDWSPLKLFSATFNAERVFAERIEVARLPEGRNTPKEEAGSFSLPVSLDLQRIELPDIALGPALAGGVASVAATGSARVEASPMQVVSRLYIARNDGRAGNIDASIDFAPDENRLSLDLNASEPQGGIIANLLKLPGEPPVEINVSGSGPAADWAGKGTFAVDGNVITQVDARHQFTDRGSAIEATGEGDFERFLPQNLKPLLAGRASFDIAGTLIDGGGVEVQRATIQSENVTATASGVLDPEGASDFSLQLNAANEGVPLSFGTEDSPIDMIVREASIRALGAGDEPNVDIAAVLQKVATNDVELRDLSIELHSDGFNIVQRIGPVSGTAIASALIIDNPNIAPLVAGRVSAGLAGILTADSLTVTDGNLASDALDGKFSGDVSLVDGSVTLKINADVASSALPAATRRVMGERVVLDADISRDHEGLISADPFTVSSEHLTASGRVRAANQEIDAEMTGQFSDVGLLAEGASGAVNLAVTAKGAFARPDLSLTVTSDRLEAAGREITGLRLVATGKADIDNPAADVSLTGNVGGEALDGKASLSTAGGRREVRDLSLSLGENRIAGNLVLDEKFLPLGRVDFQLPDVGALAALALETVQGDITGSIDFTDQAGRPQIAVKATTNSLSRGDLNAANVAVDATVSDYVSAPTVAGRIQAQTVTSGTTVVRGVDVRLTQDDGWTGFDGGATVSDIPAQAAGRVQVAGGRTVIELASGQATVQGLVARLARASTVEIVDGTTRLDNVALDIGGGTVTVAGTAGTTLALDVTLTAVPASVVNNFAPGLDLDGAISGTARVTGAASDPSVRYSLDWRGAQAAQTRGAGLGSFNVASTGEFASGRLQFQTNASDGTGLALSGGGSVDTRSNALSLDFSGGVPFGILGPRLAQSGLALTGEANVSLQIRGSTSSPVIGGSVTTSGARFIAAASGIAINDIGAEVVMANGVATIRALSGNLSTGGTISGSGTIGMDSGFPTDITLQIRDGRYTDGRVVTTTMTGDLAIRGQLMSQPMLSGTINLGRTVINVPDRLPTSLAELDVQHLHASEAVLAQQRALSPGEAASGGGSGALLLDLTINAGNQIFVTGRGLDAELGGSLRLTGSTASPAAVGEFTLRRGRLSLIGRRLTFTTGTIAFAGSLVPTLNFVAQSDVGDATVSITVSGQANNPRFDFSSVPALPQDEVLARLIFGRSMSNLSPLQIAQLADAAATLAGAGGTSSLLQSLRNRIGIDDLDIRTNDDGSTSVSAGKYLNDRTYFSLERGEKAGSGRARIDLDVGRGLKLRGEASDDGAAKGGIFYEREY